MADNSKKLLIRVTSAVLFGLVVLGLGYFGGTTGLLIVSLFAIGMAIKEYSRMLFQPPHNIPRLNLFFILVCAALAAGLAFSEFSAAAILASSLSGLLIGSIWLTRNKISNEELLSILALMGLGLIYCVYFPLFAIYISRLNHGSIWFLFLLCVVFFGDTFAYFGGRFFGKDKLMPQISPNKTVAGAVAGVAGSCLSGAVIVYYQFPTISMAATIVFCLVCGFTAQGGDLFMSLVKRVAKVKDSGHLMPGHGGILDRLDGLFIACPLVYAFALFWQG